MVRDDLSLVERHFRKSLGLGTTEIDTIEELLTETPPNIIHHYAREGDNVPLWAIVLMEENESTRFIGNDLGIIGEQQLVGEGEDAFDPDDPAAGDDAQGSIYSARYGVLTYTEHPDVTRYYYELAKFLFTHARPALMGVSGIIDLQFSGGDLAPDPRYIPAHLFVRQFVLETQRLECVAVPVVEGRATKLAGAHVDDGVSSTNKGGVTSKITVTTGET